MWCSFSIGVCKSKIIKTVVDENEYGETRVVRSQVGQVRFDNNYYRLNGTEIPVMSNFNTDDYDDDNDVLFHSRFSFLYTFGSNNQCQHFLCKGLLTFYNNIIIIMVPAVK